MAISPDGKQIAFTNLAYNLVVVNTDGSGERILSRRDNMTSWYESWGSQMSWSPDGRTIAICGNRIENGRKRAELIEIAVSDGTERQIPVPNWDYLDDVQWLADRSGLLVIARETSGSPFQIWRVAYPTGETSRITNDFQNYNSISLSANSRVFIAEQQIGQFNIWAAPLADKAKQAKQLTFGSAASDGTRGLALFPDGRIVFTSPRSGNLDLWMMNADGSNQQQLTANAGENFRPHVSPDGRYIVFITTRTGVRRVWRMDADGGNPKQLIDSDGAEHYARISPDGRWVYYTRLVGGKETAIWKVSIEGGEPVRRSAYDKTGCMSISPDGRLLAYGHHDPDSPNPWKLGVMSTETGETVKLFDFSAWSVKWSPDSTSFIYNPDLRSLWKQSLDGGLPSRLMDLDSDQFHHFDISSDFKTIVMSRGNSSTEAVLISGFHTGDMSGDMSGKTAHRTEPSR